MRNDLKLRRLSNAELAWVCMRHGARFLQTCPKGVGPKRWAAYIEGRVKAAKENAKAGKPDRYPRPYVTNQRNTMRYSVLWAPTLRILYIDANPIRDRQRRASTTSFVRVTEEDLALLIRHLRYGAVE